jgi:hypothetical protein
MILGLTRLLDALRGDSRAEELALMEAQGVATPEEFSRADPPFDSCLDAYVAHYLGVAGAAAGRMTCRAWCTALSHTRTMAQLVHREATACGRAPPLGFAESLARGDGAHHAWRLARAALRRRKLVVGERWAAQAVRSMRAVRNVVAGNFTDRNRWAGSHFLLLNESDVPLYVHWINFDGEIEVRPGDRVEPRPAPFTRGGYLLGAAYSVPAGVFYHTSLVSHSFAICLEAGGPPIACYQQRRSYLPFSFGRTWVIQHVHGVAVRRGADGQLEVRELACVDRKLQRSAPADAQTRASFDHLYVAPTAEPMHRIRVEPLHVRVPPRDADDFAWSTEIETDLTPALLADRLAGIDLKLDLRDWRIGPNPVAFRDLRPTQHGCPISYSYVDAGLVGQMLWENIWRQYDAGNSPPAGPRYAFEQAQ